MKTPVASVRVLFDESHSEAWTIRPEIAGAIQPAHPGDSSLARAAEALAEREFEVEAHTSGALTADVLAGASVLVIAHPSDPKWEATVDGGSPLLDPTEIEAIDAFVRAGGGLVVLGETEQDKYGSNLNELARPVRRPDRVRHRPGLRAPPRRRPLLGARLARRQPRRRAAARLRPARRRRGRLLLPRRRAQQPKRRPGDRPHPADRLAAQRSRWRWSCAHGEGRVVVTADSDLFGDDCIADLDHEALWLNLIYWAAQPALRRRRRRPAPPQSPTTPPGSASRPRSRSFA